MVKASNCQLITISWLYVSVALAIAVLFLVDRTPWEGLGPIQLENKTAATLNYASLCLSMFTLVEGPFFAVAVVAKGPFVITALMVVIEQAWLCLTIAYSVIIVSKLLSLTSPASDPYSVNSSSSMITDQQHQQKQEQQEKLSFELTLAPIFLFILVLVSLQLFFVKLTLSANRGPFCSSSSSLENGSGGSTSGGRRRGLIHVSPSLPTYSQATATSSSSPGGQSATSCCSSSAVVVVVEGGGGGGGQQPQQPQVGGMGLFVDDAADLLTPPPPTYQQAIKKIHAALGSSGGSSVGSGGGDHH